MARSNAYKCTLNCIVLYYKILLYPPSMVSFSDALPETKYAPKPETFGV